MTFSFTHVFKKIEATMRGNCISKELRFLQLTAKHQDFFYHIYDDKSFIRKYPNNAPIDSVLTSRTSRRLLEKKAPVNNSVGTVPSAKKYCCK